MSTDGDASSVSGNQNQHGSNASDAKGPVAGATAANDSKTRSGDTE